MADLEPARALAERPPNARSRAEDIIRLVYDLEGSPCATEKEVAELLEADRAAIRDAALREADEAITRRIEAEERREAKMPPGEPESITQSAAVCGLEWARHELAALLTGGKTHG